MKSRGSQASVTDEAVQFLADHRFGKLRDDLPHDTLDDLGRKLEDAFDLFGGEPQRLETLDDGMRD